MKVMAIKNSFNYIINVKTYFKMNPNGYVSRSSTEFSIVCILGDYILHKFKIDEIQFYSY